MEEKKRELRHQPGAGSKKFVPSKRLKNRHHLLVLGDGGTPSLRKFARLHAADTSDAVLNRAAREWMKTKGMA